MEMFDLLLLLTALGIGGVLVLLRLKPEAKAAAPGGTGRAGEAAAPGGTGRAGEAAAPGDTGWAGEAAGGWQPLAAGVPAPALPIPGAPLKPGPGFGPFATPPGPGWPPDARSAPRFTPPAPPGRRAAVTLEVVGGADRGRRFALYEGDHRLGRLPGSQVCLSDPAVSGLQAIVRVAPGQVLLFDDASANGTYLNGQQVLGPQVLQDGDQITVGQTTLAVRMADTGAMEPALAPAVAPAAVPATELLTAAPSLAAAATVPLQAPVAWLAVEEGPDAGLTAALLPGDLTVGRLPGDGGWQLPTDGTVSREHLRFRVTQEAITVRDLGSTNGTQVNGERISGEVPVWFDDSIRIGQTTLRLSATPPGSPS